VNEDFLDMFEALLEAEVEFIVVGAHALAVHGVPRATGDIDLFVRRPPQRNGARRPGGDSRSAARRTRTSHRLPVEPAAVVQPPTTSALAW
jgi:hypothetical protein